MLNSDEFLKGNLTSSFYLNRKKNIPEVKREDKEKARSIIIFESDINAQIYLRPQNRLPGTSHASTVTNLQCKTALQIAIIVQECLRLLPHMLVIGFTHYQSQAAGSV